MRTNNYKGIEINDELNTASEIKYKKFRFMDLPLALNKTDENVLYFMEVTTVFKLIILLLTSHSNEPSLIKLLYTYTV